MSYFLDAQPAADRDRIKALLNGEAVHMALLIHADFATEPLFMSDRAVEFVDNKWGYVWGRGKGLLVGIPNLSSSPDNLAPMREYQLGLPIEAIDSPNWRADLVRMVGDVGEYRGREISMYGQLFDPYTSQPVGHPFTHDKAVMDKMRVSFGGWGAVVTLQAEGLLARKGAPTYGYQSYEDQLRRYPGDEFYQFTTENKKLVTWTQFD